MKPNSIALMLWEFHQQSAIRANFMNDGWKIFYSGVDAGMSAQAGLAYLRAPT